MQIADVRQLDASESADLRRTVNAYAYAYRFSLYT